MIKHSMTALTTAGVYLGSSVMASAHHRWWHWYNPNPTPTGGGGGTTTTVPEIDASTGLLAIAAVMAALLLAWELKRRRAS